jgi:MFS family permease
MVSFTNPFLMAGQFQILTTVAGDPGGLAKIYAGRVISGVGVGAISAVAPAYVSECSPKEVRGRITGLFQLMVKRPYDVPTQSELLTELLDCSRRHDFLFC